MVNIRVNEKMCPVLDALAITFLLAFLYFVRSGTTNIHYGRLKDGSRYGRWWLSLAASQVWENVGLGAHYLAFGVINTPPSHGPSERWNGYALRCRSKPKSQKATLRPPFHFLTE